MGANKEKLFKHKHEWTGDGVEDEDHYEIHWEYCRVCGDVQCDVFNTVTGKWV